MELLTLKDTENPAILLYLKLPYPVLNQFLHVSHQDNGAEITTEPQEYKISSGYQCSWLMEQQS